MAAKIFFSYSHKDEGLRDQLEVQLAMLKRQGLVESWHDRRMVAGDALDWTIENYLNAADVILLLISPDFLNSDYCYNIEKSRALERQQSGKARLISVILRPCDWMHTDLKHFLVTPRDGKPVTLWPNSDEAFLDIVQAIRRAIEEIGKGGPPLAQHLRIERSRQEMTVEPQMMPRSSNLRLRKQFSQAERDDFMVEAFNYISKFFQGSLNELEDRNQGITGRFRAIDANAFTAAIYRNGAKVEGCTIRLGGFAHGISYSSRDDLNDNSYNESLSVEHDDQALYLKALGMPRFGQAREKKLSLEGAAEYYWAMLLERLQ